MAIALKRLSALKRFTDPRSVSGLAAWYDATQGLYSATSGGSLVTANGGAIARWEDMSGNGRHLTQSTTSYRPTLLTSGRNGRNVVAFNSDGMTAAFPGLGQNKVYAFYVARFNAWPNNTNDHLWGMTGPDAGRLQVFNYLGTLQHRFHTNGFWDPSIASFNNTNYYYAFASFPRAINASYTYQLYIDKVLRSQNTASDNGGNYSAARTFYVGHGGDPTSYGNLNGTIAEIAFYVRPNNLSSKDIQNINNYFSAKWGF
jgi:hypothetical protein